MDSTGRMQISVDGISEVDATLTCALSADAGSAVACVLRLAAGIEFYTFCIRAYKRCGLPFW